MASKQSRRQFGWVRALPSGRFQASYVGPDGLRRIAPSTYANKTDAHNWLTLRQAELLRGEWSDPELGRLELGAYGERWIAEHRLAERTRELYEGLFRLHIRPMLGRRQLSKITTDVVRTWRASLLDSGRSAQTTAKAYRLLRAMMSTAVDDGRIRRNPCRVKGADQAHTPERPTATVPQVYRLAEGIGGRYRVFVLAAAFTGLRWGELLALRRIDVDLDAGTVRVHRSIAQLTGGRLVSGPPKSRAGIRTVTLPRVLIDELRTHLAVYVGPADLDLIFVGPKGATPKRGNWRVSVRWVAQVAAAGLPVGFHFHDLRHTGNHLAAESGASTRELMHRMGHSTMAAALLYQHATDQRAREIATRLSEVLESRKTDVE